MLALGKVKDIPVVTVREALARVSYLFSDGAIWASESFLLTGIMNSKGIPRQSRGFNCEPLKAACGRGRYAAT